MSSPTDLFEFGAPAHAADALLCDPASVAHAPHAGLLLPQYHVDEHCMGGVYDDPFAHRAHDLVVDPMFGGLCANDEAAAAAAAAAAAVAHAGEPLPTISVLSSSSWLSSAMDMSAFVDQLRTAQMPLQVAGAAAAMPARPQPVNAPVAPAAAASPSTPVSCATAAAAAAAGSPHMPGAAAAAGVASCTTSPAAIVYAPIKSEHVCVDDGACAQSLSADSVSKPRKPRSIKRRYDEIELDPDLIRSVKESAWSDLQALEDKARLGTLLPEEEAEYKRQKRLVKNREAAAISRLRKKCFVDELEHKIQDLTADNSRLSAEASSLRMQNAALAAEVSALRSALAATAAVVAPAAASCAQGGAVAAPVLM